MALPDMVSEVRYVTNGSGEKTDVLLSFEVWSQLLQLLQVLMEQLENQEDAEVVRSWLRSREEGTEDVMSIEAFKAELEEEGLVPG